MKWLARPSWVNRLRGGVALIVAGGLLFALTIPVNADAAAFAAAQLCRNGGALDRECYRWLTGTVTGIGAIHSENEAGPGTTIASLTLDLPIGQRTVQVDASMLPPGRPRLGDAVDVKLWRQEITDIRVAGATTAAVGRPAVRLQYLQALAGLVCLVGLMVLAGYALDRRAGYV